MSKTPRIINSFNAAIEGFLYVIKSQRNMRIHFLLGLMVMLLGIRLNFTRIEIILLCFTVCFVLVTEMINTAIETMLNRIKSSYSPWVKLVKDVSAGAVLVASLNAVITGYFLFFRNDVVEKIFTNEVLRISQSNWHMSFFILLVLLGIVIGGKTLFHKGTPLRGGMPSGHATIAFSVWVLVTLISQNALLSFTVFILAFMIAQSRIGRHYHTFWEVLAGSIIGIVATVLMYRLFTG